MKREIKFRVWDSKAKQLLYPDAIAIYDKDKKYKAYFPDCIGVFDDEVELMQFTGLTDKTGKEIYEGDLVKTNPTHITISLKSDVAEYSCGEVKWLCNAFKICQENIGATYAGNYAAGNYAACDCCPCGLEVIGNIFENPELLK